MGGESEIDVGEADPGALPDAGLEHALDRVARDAPTVVTHRHAQAAAAEPGAHDQVERTIGLAVLDRVLDERLDEERRQAHAEYAVDAFAVEAFDYLLKPVDPDRLARVVERLHERTQENAAPVEKVAVVVGGGTELLDHDQIHYVQAEGDYSRVHTYDRAYLSTVSLGELEERLGSRFARIHRSYLVNLAKVSGVRRAADRFRLQLADAQRTELDVSRRQSREVRERLGL